MKRRHWLERLTAGGDATTAAPMRRRENVKAPGEEPRRALVLRGYEIGGVATRRPGGALAVWQPRAEATNEAYHAGRPDQAFTVADARAVLLATAVILEYRGRNALAGALWTALQTEPSPRSARRYRAWSAGGFYEPRLARGSPCETFRLL